MSTYYEASSTRGMEQWKYYKGDFTNLVSLQNGSNQSGLVYDNQTPAPHPIITDDFPNDMNHVGGHKTEGPYDPMRCGDGVGYVNLQSFAYKGQTLPNINFLNKKLVITITMASFSRQINGLFGVWIQGKDSNSALFGGKLINLFMKARPICTAFALPNSKQLNQTAHNIRFTKPQTRTITIPMSTNPADWMSMGSSDYRRSTYVHWTWPYEDALARILRTDWSNIGLICIQEKEPIAHIDPSLDLRFRRKFRIDEFRIEDHH